MTNTELHMFNANSNFTTCAQYISTNTFSFDLSVWLLYLSFVVSVIVGLNVTIADAYPNQVRSSCYFTCCANCNNYIIRMSLKIFDEKVLVILWTYHTTSGRRSKTFGCGCFSILNGDRTTVQANMSSVDSSIGCDAVFSSGV